MGGAGGYLDEAPAVARHGTLRALRALLWCEAAVTAPMLAAGLAAGLSAGGPPVRVVAGLAAFAWPGAVAGLAAVRMARPRAAHVRVLVAAMAWQLALAASTLAAGDPRGLTSALPPAAILVLLRTPPVRAHYPHARPLRTRGPETGAALLEYVALGVLAALVLGALTTLGIPSHLTAGFRSTICTVVGARACAPVNEPSTTGHPAATHPYGTQPGSTHPGDGAPNRTSPGRTTPHGENPAGAAPACHGVLGCLWHAVTTDPHDAAQRVPCDGLVGCAEHAFLEVWGSQWNVDRAALSDVTGIKDVFRHPASLAEAMRYANDHPLETLRGLVWDDESTRMWNDGNPIGAVSRGIWNVGSWLIPGGQATKSLTEAAKLSRLAKASRLAAKAGELSRLARTTKAAAKAADRARRLAAKGDYEGARKASKDARNNANAAEREARKKGCKAISLPPLRFHVAGRFAAPFAPVPPEGNPADPCEAARDAEHDADDAEHAVDPPKEIAGYTDHGMKNRLERDGHGVSDEAMQEAVRHPVKKAVFTPDKYGGSWRFTGKDAAVVLNKDGKVVTTWARSRLGWRH